MQPESNITVKGLLQTSQQFESGVVYEALPCVVKYSVEKERGKEKSGVEEIECTPT